MNVCKKKEKQKKEMGITVRKETHKDEMKKGEPQTSVLKIVDVHGKSVVGESSKS
jgi:hypothetical protein